MKTFYRDQLNGKLLWRLIKAENNYRGQLKWKIIIEIN